MTTTTSARSTKINTATGSYAAHLGSASEALLKDPVMFVHGWLDNLESFSPLLDALTDRGMLTQWLAMDLPGHGQSPPKAPQTVYHFIDGVADILSVAEHMAWTRFHLVGHSMGAALSLMLAAAFPERVLSVAAMDALGPVTAPEDALPERLRRHLQHRLQGTLRAREFTTVEEAVRRRADISGLSPSLIGPMVRRSLKKTAKGWCWRTDPRLRWPTPVRLTEEQVRVALRAVRCPVLVFRATQSLPRISQDIDARFSELRRGALVRMPGGHHCHMEAPDEVACALLSWWKQEGFVRSV